MSETLIKAQKALDEARSIYDAAHKEAEAARRGETNALNRLSEAQKAFDAAVIEVRKDAPWNSNWHQSLKRGACEEV